MKFASFVSALALAGAGAAAPEKSKGVKTRKIANIEVIDTPLVNAAIDLVRVFQPIQPYLYNHVLRTWLFGSAALNNNATLKASIDLELHAIGSMLHDLGWDMRNNTPWHSLTHPFEVDSGLGAVEFVKQNKKLWTSHWDDARLEKLYDGIVLQGQGSYLPGKNFQSQFIVSSVGFEIPGSRSPMIRDEDYDTILTAYPNHYILRGSNETFTYLCETKPAQALAGTFTEGFGVYVPGFDTSPYKPFAIITNNVAVEKAAYGNETAYTGSILGPGAV
ncbi:hypothetical protein GGR57DRAFT_486366 [Xylariaceae sp. FL1272]|nr:hypothetical protein GGR57DRAFT_486366 [Xylariaceae sp. FL1272]